MILLVEDNPGDITLFQTALQSTPSRCLVARSAGDAIACLANPENDIHEVVIDLRLTGKDGWSILEYLHALPETRVNSSVLTSSANERDREQAAALGVSRYWVKPDDFAELRQIVHEISKRDSSGG